MKPEAVTGGLSTSDKRLIGAAGLALVAALATYYGSVPSVLAFAFSGVALALLAALVGRSVDRLGDRLGSGATGVLQAGLGNLPELFIGIFALRDGLVPLLQATLVGSMLANVLLVLGLAFVAGGLRHGTQRYSTEGPRLSVLLLVLAVAIIMVPTLSFHLDAAAAPHVRTLSNIAAVLLLAVFALSIPASLKAAPHPEDQGVPPEEPLWPMGLVITVLSLAAVTAAFVSDWFVAELTPALSALHISEVFAGLVIVAIAGNTVENWVGVKLSFDNRPDYALSVILQSPVQIALAIVPVLVLLSNFVGGGGFTLVMPTLLVSALGLATVVTIVVVLGGRSAWLEGVTLIGLYVTTAAAFWWG